MKKYIAATALGIGLALAAPGLAQEGVDCKVLDSMVKLSIDRDLATKSEQFKGLRLPLLDYYVREEAQRCLPRKYKTFFGIFEVTIGKQDFYLQGYTWYEIKEVISKE